MSTKHLTADERRTVTIETVIQLAGEQNPSEITTATITERMNLSQGALFRHFPTKDALWGSVMEWVAARLMSRIDHAVKDVASPLDALQAMFMAHVGFITDHPGVPRMMFGEMQRAEPTAPKRMAQTLIKRYGERVRALLERGQALGEIDPELDITAAATLFVGTIQGLVMQSLLAGDVRRIRTEAPAVLQIYLRGVRVSR